MKCASLLAFVILTSREETRLPDMRRFAALIGGEYTGRHQQRKNTQN